MDGETQTTLRDLITENVESVEAEQPLQNDVAPAAEATQSVTDDAVIGETAEQKEARIRDEKGRFAKGEQAEKPVKGAKPAEAAAAPAPEKPRPQRPSTWKKDYWESFDKLAAENPALAEYINQRESEYAKGVSTYKNEAERAKEIWGALEPFMPDLQANGIQPAQWIGNLGRAHQTLAMGSPQQKVQMFQNLARSYGVPLQALVPQAGPDGQPMGAPVEQFLEFVNPLHQELRQVRSEVNAWKSQQEQQRQAEIQSEIERFKTDRPHFEQVRETMAGLLQSGLAQDLDSAYEAAVRMPQHDEIFQAMQQQQREDSERRAAEARRATAERARNQTTSTKSGAPTAPRAASGGKSGLRELLEEAVESHASGRV